MADLRQLTVPGEYEYIRQVCDFVVNGAGLSGDLAFQVRLACDEACTNIIEHAYGGEEKGDISVTWEVQNQELIIIFGDTGKPFKPAAVPGPGIPNPEDFRDLKVGGLGLHIIRQVMDEVAFTFSDNGNKLRLSKHLA
jgi:serine/threonine-protein kinase RsbW